MVRVSCSIHFPGGCGGVDGGEVDGDDGERVGDAGERVGDADGDGVDDGDGGDVGGDGVYRESGALSRGVPCELHASDVQLLHSAHHMLPVRHTTATEELCAYI